MIFIKFFAFIEHSKPINLTLSDFIEKFSEDKKKFNFLHFARGAILTSEKNCSLKSNWHHKLLIMESYIEISPVGFEL